jgi:hypothetical protein
VSGLDAAAILAAQDLPLEQVEVPEWGGSVWLRPLTAGDAGQFQAEMAAAGTVPGDFRVRLVARCLVDSEGVRLFPDAEIPALAEKNAEVVNRLYDRCAAMNGLAPGAVETAQGN